MNVKQLSGRLCALGIIDKKAEKSLDEISEYSAPAPNFRAMIEHGLAFVEKWHNTATELGYASPVFKELIRDGVAEVISFGKSNKNKKNIKNSSLTGYERELCLKDAAMHELAGEIRMTGGTDMNVRTESLEIVGVYKRAIPEIRKNIKNETSIATIDKACVKLSELEAEIMKAADHTSKSAAEFQAKIFSELEVFGADFANGQFTEKDLAALDKAITAAQAWSLVMPVSGKSKLAKEGDVKTKENINRRILDFSLAAEAEQKVDQLKDVVMGIKENFLNTTFTEELEERIASYEKEREELYTLKDNIYADTEAGVMEIDEFNELDIEYDERIADLNDDIAYVREQMRSDKAVSRQFAKNIDDILGICNRILRYRSMPSHLVSIAKNINFEPINNFLEGAHDIATTSEIVALSVHLDVIEKQMMDSNVGVNIREARNSVRLNLGGTKEKTKLSDEESRARFERIRAEREGRETVRRDSVSRNADLVQRSKSTVTEDDN